MNSHEFPRFEGRKQREKCFVIFPFLLCLLLLHGPVMVNAQSSEGYSFWLSFMEHIDAGANQKLIMITAKRNTSGFVEIPNRSWRYPFSVAENNVTLFWLPSFTEVLGSETIEDVGVHLISDSAFAVYIHQYSTNRSEATSILPEEALGQEYYAISYRGSAVGEISYPSEFLVLATQDETLIEITPRDITLAGRMPDSTFSILLNKGEAYQVQAKYSTGDLTGSHIIGNKNFALFAGASTTGIPVGCLYRDNLLEQMFPIEMWGKEYITVPNHMTDFDVFRIVAAEDNSRIQVQATTQAHEFVLNKGEFAEYQESGASYIKSDRPIQVVQYNVSTECSGHDVGDPSMILLNSIAQTKDTVTLYSSPYQEIKEHYVNIIMRAEDSSYVVIDGKKLSDLASIQTIGPDDKYAWSQIEVLSGVHTIFSEGCGIIATAYGYGHLESYAYSGGSAFRKVNAHNLPDGNCLGDSAYFEAALQEPRFSFYWDLGDGTTSRQKDFTHYYPELGIYPVELRIYDNCLEVWDTVSKDYEVSLRQAVDVIDDPVLCVDDSIVLGAWDYDSRASYVWTGPWEYHSEKQFPVLSPAQPSMSGEYEVIGLINGCATYPSYVNVVVHRNPEPELGPDRTFCIWEGDHLLDPGSFTSYYWQDSSISPVGEAREDGLYWVMVTDENSCTAKDSVNLKQECPVEIYIPNVFSPNNDGVNDRFGPLGAGLEMVHMQIFNRWGSMIFETDNPDDHWDGSFRGSDVEVGLYIWKVVFDRNQGIGSADIQSLSGSVLLMR